MQISPVYDDVPVLTFEGLGSPAAAVRRQRERLLALLGTLSAPQWDTPSRCDKWSVKDVVAHLVGVDRFWEISVAAAMRGEPTTFLANFDPAATPEQMVDGLRTLSPDEVLAQFEAKTSAFLATLDTVTDWSQLSEAPPGHIPLHATALHALWDAWIHERDIMLPLALTPVVDDEEVRLALRYAAALSPAISVAARAGRRGTLAVQAKDPACAFTVHVEDTVVVRDGLVGGPTLRGDAVELVEGLSHRGPLPSPLAADDMWLLAGLADVFDVA
ncbi:MAG TPA: maleylpyruvate isomerase family mycothiol-dependent enzyme [Acidimicrobiales bacterium]|nr:maleylpyruvate isomerase family mycothiol-dependent enzyme [Acidimicrobiales bacterium]